MRIQDFKKINKIIISILFIGLVSSCSDDTVEIQDDSVSLTDSYRVEYLSNMDMIREGRSDFTVLITDRSSGVAQSGLMVNAMPMMTMAAGHMHDTPVSSVTDNGDGTYDATVYYLMPSAMMDGTVMGDWELQLMIGGMGGEVAHFYPDVMMAMGDTVKATLQGQSDMIMGMMAAENRKYFIFNHELSGVTANHNFTVFVAARESMMSHTVVYPGVILNAADINYELSVSAVSVEVSTDMLNWSAATDNGAGYYAVNGITGLTAGTEATLYVRLMVNGEQKTMDGNAAAGDGSNDYGMFTVTP